MRESLFRGKRVDNGEWVYGYLISYVLGATPIIVRNVYMEDNCSLEFDYEHVDHETVGEFTGLLDKNGKKIFEGDVLRFHNRSNYPVFWDADFAAFGSCYYDDFDPLSKYDNRKIKVIGNIHDNPELVKEDAE